MTIQCADLDVPAHTISLIPSWTGYWFRTLWMLHFLSYQLPRTIQETWRCLGANTVILEAWDIPHSTNCWCAISYWDLRFHGCFQCWHCVFSSAWSRPVCRDLAGLVELRNNREYIQPRSWEWPKAGFEKGFITAVTVRVMLIYSTILAMLT